MSYRLINANSIVFNSDGFITAENIEKMPCIYADLPNGMDGEHYVLEQEPKTGRWWERDTYPQECECWDCSECQETVFERTNYCPNCGARMIEPQERSDKE